MMIRIVDIIGSPVAISPSKADLLYGHFVHTIKSGIQTSFSFLDIQECSSAFCNASIGNLYMKFDEQEILRFISFQDFEEEIWIEKVNRAKMLGIDENYRNNSQQTLEEIIS